MDFLDHAKGKDPSLLQREISGRRIEGFLGLSRYKVWCTIGVYPFERESKREIYIDIKVKVDISSCVTSGNFNDTVDYGRLGEICKALGESNHYYLLETYAFDITEACFSSLPISYIFVRVEKRGAIADCESAFVEMERGTR